MRSLALIAVLGACSSEPLVLPYGFAGDPQQRLRVEAEEQLQIDDVSVSVRRYADIRLVAEQAELDRVELVLYLERYYLKVEGAPGGTTEVALSDKGLAAQQAGGERLQLGPGDQRPGGGAVSELLQRPVAGCRVSEQGHTMGESWHSYDPILSGVGLLDWVLLGFPVSGPADEKAWSERRRVPPLGQYRLGLELPLRYERTAPPMGSGTRIRASAVMTRSDLTVAPGFSGELSLDHRGQTDFAPGGRLQRADLELRMRFEASSGSLVTSEHRLRLTCLDCEGLINSPSQVPDSFGE